MGRKPCCSKEEGLNSGASTTIENQIPTDYINAHGAGKWGSLPKAVGLKRCGKSCRLHWLHYLTPDVKTGDITSDEEDLIVRLHKLLGNRWSSTCEQLMKSRIIKEGTSELDRTNKDEKEQGVIGWSRKAPNGSGSGGVVHAKAKRCTTGVFINPQQQMIVAKDDNDFIRRFPSIDAKLVHENAEVESESS